jgi:hypothetical protein
MNTTHNDQLQSALEEPLMKLPLPAQFQRPVKPWHRMALCQLIAATGLGLATLGAVRSLLAQPPPLSRCPRLRAV